MSDIAAAKKAEGNAYFAKKMYSQAVECYSEVSLFVVLNKVSYVFVGH